MKTENVNYNTSESNGIRYNYCLDENDELIHISEVTKEDRKVHNYKCLCCGQKMILRCGQVRQKHFAHKVEGTCNLCSNESYLHKLAKIRIKECFDRGELWVHHRDEVLCSEKEQCKMFENSRCLKEAIKNINLHEYYDTCEIEKRIGDDVVADLLLTNSDKPNRKPVLIEVFVTHSCSAEKINKGLKIFETKQIRSEEDINNIIKEGIKTSAPNLYFSEEVGSGYNITISQKHETCVKRLALFPNWEYELEQVRCNGRNEEFFKSSLLELNINKSKLAHNENLEHMESLEDTIGLLYAAHNGYGNRICAFCKLKETYCLRFAQENHTSSVDAYALHCNYFSSCELLGSISIDDLNKCVEVVKNNGPMCNSVEDNKVAQNNYLRVSVDKDTLMARLNKLDEEFQRKKDEAFMSAIDKSKVTTSLTPNAVQVYWKIPTEFPCCPQNPKENPLEEYQSNLKAGTIFCQNRRYSSCVRFSFLTNGGKCLWVLAQSIKEYEKPWALDKVFYKDGKFYHVSVRNTRTVNEARMYFILESNKEYPIEGYYNYNSLRNFDSIWNFSSPYDPNRGFDPSW